MGDSMDDTTATTPTPIPLKKCIECGDEWITDQYEVTCLATGNTVILVVVDPEPIDIDEIPIPNPCRAGRHTLTEFNQFSHLRKGRTKPETGCNDCLRERNREAKRRQKAKRLRLEAEKLAHLYYEMDNNP